MLDFFKRNIKFVAVIGVSVLVIGGLSAALLVTNIASASDRGRERNRDRSHQIRVELTEEQRADRIEQAKEKLEQRLADEKITQEEFDEKMAALESGEYPANSRNKRGGGNKGHRGNKDVTPAEGA